jgi:tetratricopeptide (TPR) repeat protein
MVPYPERTADGNLPSGLIITGIIVFVVMLIFVFLLFRYYKRNRTVAFGAIWFIISISVVMHIIPIEGRVLAADRYAYPAYIGLFLMMACFADFLLQKLNKKLMIFIFLSIILILSITTFMNIDTWKNSKTLWTKALDINPKNHYAMYSLGLAYFTDDKKPEKAVEYLDKAIALKENFQYYNNRGRFKFVLNDIKGSLKDINKSIELDSNSYAAYNNRGAIQQKFGNFKGALDDFNKALKLKPNFTEASNNRSKVLRLLALDSLINNNVPISSEQKPEIIEFIKRTSDIYIINKDFEKASQLLQKGINIDPYYSVFHEMLAVMYQVNNDFGKALNAYNQGLLYMPSEASLLIGRALLYLEKGDTIKACHDLKFADKRQYPEAASLSKQLCGE